jgi:hypothetical protein
LHRINSAQKGSVYCQEGRECPLLAWRGSSDAPLSASSTAFAIVARRRELDEGAAAEKPFDLLDRAKLCFVSVTIFRMINPFRPSPTSSFRLMFEWKHAAFSGSYHFGKAFFEGSEEENGIMAAFHCGIAGDDSRYRRSRLHWQLFSSRLAYPSDELVFTVDAPLGQRAPCVDGKSHREQISCVGDRRYPPDARRVRRELSRSIPVGASSSRLSTGELQHSFLFWAKAALLAKRHRPHAKQNSGETTS